MCAFCRAHESEFELHGVEGTAKTSIEHRVPQTDPIDGARLKDVYSNCYYACRFCNRARSTRPIVNAEGRRLLDPCVNAWTEHFFREGHEFLPLDRDAEYTREAYDINDARKVTRREEREDTIRTAMEAVAEVPQVLARLTLLAAKAPDPEVAKEMKLQAELLRRAGRDLKRYATPPDDKPLTCSCIGAAHRTLTEQDAKG